MLASETVLKWAMRFYPPFLFQGIWTRKFDNGFLGVRVKIIKNICNRNYNRTIFGGTIFSAVDPFPVLLFHQLLKRKGYFVQLWTKHASIDFIKPATRSLYFNIALTEDDLQEAILALEEKGKFIKLLFEMFDDSYYESLAIRLTSKLDEFLINCKPFI